MIPLGHRTHLAAKAKGDNSMFGKAGCRETTERHVGRGPDATVKAKLLEPKYPLCQQPSSDTVADIRGPLHTWPSSTVGG